MPIETHFIPAEKRDKRIRHRDMKPFKWYYGTHNKNLYLALGPQDAIVPGLHPKLFRATHVLRFGRSGEFDAQVPVHDLNGRAVFVEVPEDQVTITGAGE